MGLNSRMGVGPRSCYVPRLRQTLFRLCPLEPFWTSLLYRHQRRSSAPHRPAQPRNFRLDRGGRVHCLGWMRGLTVLWPGNWERQLEVPNGRRHEERCRRHPRLHAGFPPVACGKSWILNGKPAFMREEQNLIQIEFDGIYTARQRELKGCSASKEEPTVTKAVSVATYYETHSAAVRQPRITSPSARPQVSCRSETWAL